MTSTLRYLSLPAMAILALAALPVRAEAQGWDEPSFAPPRPAGEIGGAYIAPDHADWGITAYWRQPGSINLGVRAGYLTDGDNSVISVGSEVLLPVNLGGALPVDVAWVGGLGAGFSDGFTALRIPVGVSIGSAVPLGSGMELYPYVHPRLGVDFGITDDEFDSELNFLVDVGADLKVGDNLTVRIGRTLADGAAWGIGLSWVHLRPVSVRGN